MATFRDANQVRISLKIKLSNYAWYSSSAVASTDDGYYVVIHVSRLDNQIRKVISPVINGVNIKTELE